MNCSQCSSPLTANAKFCKNCGARQTTPVPETAAAEKICAQCQSICKAHARFCPKCGSVFEASATATPVIRTEPPLIEPMDLPPAAPVDSAAATVFPARNDRTPSFPQEPPPNSKAWIKWAALALIVAAIAGGVLMANNMKGLSDSNSTPASSHPDKDAVSPEDKAKADALVGPLGGSTEAPATAVNDPSSVTIVNPAPVPDIPPPTVSPTPAAPAVNTSPEPVPPAATSRPVTPAPVKAPPARKSGGPSLDDLLD